MDKKGFKWKTLLNVEGKRFQIMQMNRPQPFGTRVQDVFSIKAAQLFKV